MHGRSAIGVRQWLVGGIFLLTAVLTGTSTDAAEPPPLQGGGPALSAGSYDAKVISFDGTPIAITLFVPNAPANTPVPLILMHPGWAVPRARALQPGGQFYFAPQEAAKLANDNGYFVISFDERGFYESGGTVELSSPDYEGRDIQAILDWAEANLKPQLAYRSGQLVSASLGLSYGAGTQLIGAVVDSRITTIVPAAGWNSLGSSLDPDNVPKSQWSGILYRAAMFGSDRNVDPRMTELYDEQLTGSVDSGLIDSFSPNGLQDYCGTTPPPGFGVPRVSAFLVQGEADTLFNMNEGVANAACLRAAGNDVRLLIEHYGHTLPLQPDAPFFIFGLEEQVQCGSQNFNLG